MALFSQRKGLKAAAKALQLEAIDEDLRNNLWSALNDFYFAEWNHTDMYSGGLLSAKGQQIRILIEIIWCEYFKQPTDTFPGWREAIARIRHYYFQCEWYEVYDLLEFVTKHAPEQSRSLFRELCNTRMQQENSGYPSDEGGIRHALLEKKSSISFTDAKFLLVTCSAFANYLIGKASDAGLTVKR